MFHWERFEYLNMASQHRLRPALISVCFFGFICFSVRNADITS